MKRFAMLVLLLTPACSSSPDIPAGTGLGGSGGGGGAAGAGGGAGTAVKTMSCPDSGHGPVDPTALIDNMEAGGSALPMEGGRTGSWWAGGDALSPGATITPNNEGPSEPIPNGGRCGSLHAKHVTGQGFTSWALLTATLAWGPVDGGASAALPYDAHIRTGLTFWARIGDTSTNKVRFAVSDRYTRPEGGICDPDSTTATTSTACYDTAGVDLPLATTWTQFQIPFAGLAQRGFGQKEKEGQMGPDTSAIYTIDFNFYPSTVFDFWLDDISFY
jgi:hypothetical protein